MLEGDSGNHFLTLYSAAGTGDLASIYSKNGIKFATATAKDATGWSEVMRIQNGNVGIGTTEPQGVLHVKGSATQLVVDVADATKINWMLAGQTNYSNTFEITPSTVVGGFTFSAPVWRVNNSGNVIQAGNLTVSGTGDTTIAGNVGIGTTAPLAPLHVEIGNGEAFRVSLSSGTNTGYGTFRNTGGVSVIGIENSIGGQIITESDPYAFALTAGASRKLQLGYSGGIGVAMTVDTSGNVGIGTTNPDSGILDVRQNIATMQINFKNTTSSGQGDVYLNLDKAADGNSNGIMFRTGGTQKWTLGTGIVTIDDNFRLYDSIGGASVITAELSGAVTNTLYLKGGNVGIGTTEPSALLDLLFDSASSPNMLQVTNYRSGAAPNGAMTFRASRGTASVPVAVSSDDVLGGSYVYGHNGTSFLNMGNVLVRAAGATSAYLSLETKDTGDAEAIERVRILASGNVGIGTTVPDGKLHVMTASAGTVTAGADFDDLTVENSAEAGINILGGNANMVGIAFGDDGAAISGAVKYHNADNSMRFSVNGNLEKMRIQSDGNVGIGTTVPASKLDITTAGLATTQTTSSGLALVNTTAATAIAPVQISPAIRWSGFGWKTDATAASQAVDFRAFVTPVQGTSAPTGYLGFESSINGGAYSATPAFVITSAGNIGIGTTNPNRFLEVAGQAKIGDTAGEGLFLRGASTAAHYNWLIGEQVNVGSALEITPSTAAGGETFSTPVAVFLQSGNVGIGTTTPASLTEIQGGLTTTGSVLTLGTKETTVVVNDVLGRINFYAPLEADGSDAILTGASILAIAEDTFSATVNKTSLQFQTGASETATTKMTILSDGNVGIGVSPSYRLHVSDATTAGIVGAFTNSDGTCTLDPGDVGGWSCPSDERLKKDISNFDSGLAQINQLRPVSYRLKNENENTMLSVGLLAQEVQPIFPKLVTIQPDGTLSLNYGGLTPVVIKAIQELSLNLDGVAERVALLEANAGVSGSGESIAGTLGQYAVEFFSAGVSSVVDGVAYMKGIVVDKLTIGSAAKPVGFTIYDTVTSNPFCVSMVSGVLVSLEGTCESQNQISMTASDTTDTTTSSTPASSIDSAGQATTTEESAPADTTTSNVTTTDTTSDAITSDTTDTTTNSTDTITTEESASELTAVDETPPEAVAPPEETPPPETPTPEPAPEVVSEPSP